MHVHEINKTVWATYWKPGQKKTQLPGYSSFWERPQLPRSSGETFRESVCVRRTLPSEDRTQIHNVSIGELWVIMAGITVFQMAQQNNKAPWKTNKRVRCGEARASSPSSISPLQVFVIQPNKVASTGNTTPATSALESLARGVMEGLWLHYAPRQWIDLHRAAHEWRRCGNQFCHKSSLQTRRASPPCGSEKQTEFVQYIRNEWVITGILQIVMDKEMIKFNW